MIRLCYTEWCNWMKLQCNILNILCVFTKEKVIKYKSVCYLKELVHNHNRKSSPSFQSFSERQLKLNRENNMKKKKRFLLNIKNALKHYWSFILKDKILRHYFILLDTISLIQWHRIIVKDHLLHTAHSGANLFFIVCFNSKFLIRHSFWIAACIHYDIFESLTFFSKLKKKFYFHVLFFTIFWAYTLKNIILLNTSWFTRHGSFHSVK